MKYYIIAGEASGDLHASNLLKELKKLDLMADFKGWGGEKMADQGCSIVKHYKDLAFMGFIEVAMNLRTILANIRFCKQDILSYKPDVLILVDYPGFNLRIAEWAKQQGFKVVYYISPQVWAWKENRVKSIKANVEKMLVILPFEQEFYKKWNYDVIYIGHPLVQVIDDFIAEKDSIETLPKQPDAGTIALLPGSRKQEILVKLPIMLKVAPLFPKYSFVIAKAPGIDDGFYESMLQHHQNVYAVKEKTYDLLYRSKAALVTSGTATLETALFGVPEVVCYKGSSISYAIAKRLIKVPFISLVNLIMNKEVVKELIQNDLTPENLEKELKQLLTNPERKAQLQNDYKELKNLLSKGGNASARAAKEIYKFISGEKLSQ